MKPHQGILWLNAIFQGHLGYFVSSPPPLGDGYSFVIQLSSFVTVCILLGNHILSLFLFLINCYYFF